MPKSEEAPICELCRPDRKADGLQPKRKTLLQNTTQVKKLPVWVCDHCDGDIVAIANAD